MNALSRLVGSVDNAMLRVTNNNTGASATALDLRVAQDKPPMKVNSSQKVNNLNADQLDGNDSSAVATRLHALVRGSDATLVRGSGVTATFKYATSSGTVPGSYEIVFDRDVTNCVYVATLANEAAGRGHEGSSGEIGVRPLSTDAAGVSVTTWNTLGQRADKDFSLAVLC